MIQKIFEFHHDNLAICEVLTFIEINLSKHRLDTMAYTEQAHLFYHYNMVINVGFVRCLFQTSF